MVDLKSQRNKVVIKHHFCKWSFYQRNHKIGRSEPQNHNDVGASAFEKHWLYNAYRNTHVGNACWSNAFQAHGNPKHKLCKGLLQLHIWNTCFIREIGRCVAQNCNNLKLRLNMTFQNVNLTFEIGRYVSRNNRQNNGFREFTSKREVELKLQQENGFCEYVFQEHLLYKGSRSTNVAGAW